MINVYGKHDVKTNLDFEFDIQFKNFIRVIPFIGDRKKFSGVYRITNLINGKIYIGSSLHIRGRWKEHYNKLKIGKHHSVHLQNAFNVYGEQNFKFEILEYVKPNRRLLKVREQYWMNELQSYNKEFGYNIRKKATSTFGSKRGMPIWNKGKKLVPDKFRNCSICGINFKLKYSTDTKTICSNICKGKAKQKLVDLVCPICKNTFQRRPSEIDTYCNRSCYYKSMEGNTRWVRK